MDKNQELEVGFLKKQIADLTRQREQYEELYSSSRRQHDIMALELKDLKKTLENLNSTQNLHPGEISKAFDEITTLKAKLISSQAQYNLLESNHFAEIDKLNSINEELVNKMKNELSDLKKEKMQLLTQTQQLLTKNQGLKKQITYFQVKEHATNQEESALDFWRENLEKVSIEKKELERKLEEQEAKDSNYKLALKRLNEFIQQREKEWDNKWKLRETSYTESQAGVQKRISEDEIAKLHLAAIIIKQREQEWKKCYKENDGNIRHPDQESQLKWDSEKERWLSDWKISRGLLQGLPLPLQKYFAGYEFLSEVPQIVSIEKSTSMSTAQDITPSRFVPPEQPKPNPIQKIQQDLLKSSDSNAEILNGSQSARVLPGVNFDNRNFDTNEEKLVQLPNGRFMTETDYKLLQMHQSHHLPPRSSQTLVKEATEKRSRSKSPYANRPQLDVATGYHTTNGFYSQQQQLDPNQDAKEVVLSAYSKVMSDMSDVDDIVKRYQKTDLYKKV